MKFLGNLLFPINTIICTIALAVIAFTITVLGWKPCPMCLLQQLCVVLIFAFSLLGWIKKSSRNISIAATFIVILAICSGIYVAADQVYIQYFSTPPVISNEICGGINDPLLISATKAITGTVKDCADVSEDISGFSLAVYSLTFFICLLVINVTSTFVKFLKKSEK